MNQLQLAMAALEAAYGAFSDAARGAVQLAAGPVLKLPPAGVDPFTLHPQWDVNGICTEDFWYVGYPGAQKGSLSAHWNLDKMALSMMGEKAPHTYILRAAPAGTGYAEAMQRATDLGWATVASVVADPAWGANFPILLPGGKEAAAKAAAEAAAGWAAENAALLAQHQQAAVAAIVPTIEQ